MLKKDGLYFFDGTVDVTANSLFSSDVFKELWKGFTYHKSDLNIIKTDKYIFKLGSAEELPVGDNDYAINITENGVTISSCTKNGLVYGFMTLADMISVNPNSDSLQLPCCTIAEKVLVKERMIHYCVFPDTEIWEIKRFVRFVGALKYTHIIMEFWGMLKLDCLKELSWNNGFTKKQIEPIIKESKDMGLEIIPMFNLWGHAAGCPGRTGKHVILDQNPTLQRYFTNDGWCWNIKTDEVKQLLKEIRNELLELFSNSSYFHIGCDEAFGFEFSKDSMDEIVNFINEISEELKKKGKKVIVWGNMFITKRNDFDGEVDGSNQFYICHCKDLECEQYLQNKLSKDIVIADCQYYVDKAPVKTSVLLKNAGFDVLCCPWNDKKHKNWTNNKNACIETAITENLNGIIYTTWHTLREIMPTITEAASLCWSDAKLEGAYDKTAELLRKVHFANGDYKKSDWLKNKEDKKMNKTLHVRDVMTIGEKSPHKSSQVFDITVFPAGQCTWHGDWNFSAKAKGPLTKAQNSLWVSGVGEETYVTYNPQIEAVGNINIFAYILYWETEQNNSVKYEIHHNGKIDIVMFDPTTLTKSAWLYLGTFDFSGDTEKEFVKQICQPNEDTSLKTRASTMMFEIVNEQNGDIWQTKYVSPHVTRDSLLQSAKMAELNRFIDMKDHWACYDVEYMANEKLVDGVTDDRFEPETNITRAEFTTILVKIMGYYLVNEDSYSDVEDHSAHKYITTAKTNRLLTGLPIIDNFKPNQPITREEAAVLIYNAVKATKKNDSWVKEMKTNFASFTDVSEISYYAKEAFEYITRAGIVKEILGTTLSPKKYVTRAQATVILKKFMQLFIYAGPPVEQEWTLMFQDNFDGDALDWSVWRAEKKAPAHIASYRGPENAEVKDGALYLNIKKEIPPKEGKDWSAASVWVRPEVFAQCYGYWEARYKYADTPGINNSFWTFTSHAHNIHKDPLSTNDFELDITEGHYPNKISTNYHTCITGESVQHQQEFSSPYDLAKDFHTYAMEWTPEKILYYHDGKVIREQENYNAHQLQFPYLSAAVINWAGDINDSANGTAQIIDYVRVWQKNENLANPKLNYSGQPIPGLLPHQDATDNLTNEK